MSTSQDTFGSSQSIDIDSRLHLPLMVHSKYTIQKPEYYPPFQHLPTAEPRDSSISISASPRMSNPAPAETTTTAAAPAKRVPPLGNPTPLGLSAFGLTAFCVGLYDLRAGGLSQDAPAAILIATTLCYGGIGQTLTGLMEFINGNSFGGTVWVSYGLFWISYAALFIPSFGILPGTAVSQFSADFMIQFGFMTLGWTIFTYLLWTLTWRSNLATSVLFFLLGTSFLLDTVANLGLMPSGNAVQKVAGGFSVAAGLVGWYSAMALLSGKRGDGANSYYELPVGSFAPKAKAESKV